MRRARVHPLVLLTLPLWLAACDRDRGEERRVETASGALPPPVATPPVATPAPAPSAAADTSSNRLEAGLRHARETLSRDARAFGGEVRKVAVVLKGEASRAAGKSRELLDRAAAGLDSVADRADRGGARSGGDVDRAFARVHHALSAEHARRAREALARNDATSLQDNLKASQHHLDEAMNEVGEKMERRAADDVRAGIAATSRLASQQGDARAKVDTALSTIDREIERLGQKLDRR